MIEGAAEQRFRERQGLGLSRQPRLSRLLIDLLVDATSAYLLPQIEAGAEALQIFDSWAGVLSAGGAGALVSCADGRDRARA